MAVQKDLQTLEDARLISLVLSSPEVEYTFRHSLIQEAAYRSLLRADRRNIHGQVARAIERHFRANIDQVASVIAAHYEGAGEDEPALRYYRLAGDEAAGTYANAEAAAHYGEALRLAKSLDVSEDELVALSDSYGRTLELTGGHEAAEEHYKEVEEWGYQREMASLRLGAMANRAVLYATLTPISDLVRGQELCEKVLILAREAGNGIREVQALNGLVHAHQYKGQTEQAFELAQEAIALARKLGLKEQLALTLTDVCYGRQFAGQLRLAEDLLSESVALWRELGNLPMLANALSTLAGNYMYQGRFRQGLTLAEEAMAIAARIEDRWAGAFGRVLAGGNCRGLGFYGQAVDLLKEGVSMSRSAGVAATELYCLMYLGSIYMEIGDVDAALVSAQWALAIAEDQLPYLLLSVLPVLANLYLYRGDLDRAREAIQRAEALPNRVSMALFNCFLTVAQVRYSWQTKDFQGALATAEDALRTMEGFALNDGLPQVRLLQGKALMATGRDIEAFEVLEQGRRSAESMAATGDLWPILYELWQLALKSDQQDKASLYLEQAGQAARKIADDLPDDFRRTFLRRPRVQEILSSVNRG